MSNTGSESVDVSFRAYRYNRFEPEFSLRGSASAALCRQTTGRNLSSGPNFMPAISRKNRTEAPAQLRATDRDLPFR